MCVCICIWLWISWKYFTTTHGPFWSYSNQDHTKTLRDKVKKAKPCDNVIKFNQIDNLKNNKYIFFHKKSNCIGGPSIGKFVHMLLCLSTKSKAVTQKTEDPPKAKDKSVEHGAALSTHSTNLPFSSLP